MSDDNKMIGTIKIVEFPTRRDFDDYMANEPYVTGGVWKEVQVTGFRTGPSYKLPSSDS